MISNISVLYHSCIKFNMDKIIYFDPFGIDRDYNDADIIFITHDHYDHYSEDDIKMVLKDDTFIVIPLDLLSKVLEFGINRDHIITVLPNNSYSVNGILFDTIPAYNVNKSFHPKSNNWVGYVVSINGIRYFIAGDTDITSENSKVECDVAFVPVGGTYTMDYKEAVQLVNIISPKIAIPIHYGAIVGTRSDAINFINLLKPSIKGSILLK